MRRRCVIAAFAAVVFAACDSSEVCNDGVDNDDDKLVDCEDSSDCGPGSSCGPNGLVCASDKTCSACGGNGGTPEPNGETSCNDGVDNDCDGLIDCADPDCACSNGSGPVTTGAIGHFRFSQAEYIVLGALGSGYHEQSLITFQVDRIDGSPFSGLKVSFSHVSQGGSFIGATSHCTTATPPVCTAEATTDSSGRVGVLLHSGSRFAVLSVRAQATTADVTRDVVAGGFTVVGAKPTGSSFSVDCRPYNVPALTNFDCLYSRYKGAARNVECTATLGDRHGNLVAIPTLVSFQSEAGAIAPAAVTPEYSPGSGAGLGQAVGVLDVYGAPLPWDVDPFPGEVSATIDYGCGLRTSNPRDGLVTVVAMVEGEEGFVDLNLNGRYDPGEPFIDLGEPFVDVNDNGVRDPFEWFLDLNEDGGYTGPNGVWDANTVLWTQTRIAYTGYAYFAHDELGRELFTRVWQPPPPPAPPAPTSVPAPFLVHSGPPPTTQFYGVFFTDLHLNPLGSFSAFGAEAVAGNVEASLSDPTHTADQLPASFRMLYCDHPSQPAICHDGPADQGCVTTPCYLQTDVGRSFLYGNSATLAVTGVAGQDPRVGPDVVQIWAAIEGVATIYELPGESVP